MKHVVILGGGFAGLAAAHRIGRRGDGRLRVTVVDRFNHHTFQPLLYQVATAGLGPQEVARSIRTELRSLPCARFRLGTVTAVDLEARLVTLEDGISIGYDFLVLATGSVTADFGIPGVAEHSLPLKELADAVRLRDHVLASFEEIAIDPDPHPAAMTIVVAGGGPTGVETAGAMRELLDHVVRRDFPEIDADRVRIVLVERDPSILTMFSPGSRSYAVDQLRARGVEVRLGTAISEVRPDEVRFADGSSIATRTVIWTAGVRANALAETIGLPLTPNGRIIVEPDLRVAGYPEVFAIGDISAAVGADGRTLPQMAPVAMQQGRHVAGEIVRELQGLPPERFRYRDKGSMATIGRNAAVAELRFGVRLRGWLAWVAWLGLHLLYLAGVRNRATVLVNWALSYLTYDRGARAVFRPRDAGASPPRPTRS